MNYDLLIHDGIVVTETAIVEMDIAVKEGKIAALGKLDEKMTADHEIDAKNLVVFPGLVDPHVHFREPGPNEEEDFYTGSRAAAAGGVTTVLEQPVDSPPTTTVERFNEKIQIAKQKSFVDFGLWGGVVPDNLDEIEGLTLAGACFFKAFICSSDPIYPMVDDGVMLRAMQKISACGKAIAIHAENQSIVECFTAMFNKLPSVRGSDYVTSRPAIAETEAIQRMIFLAKHANVNLHILHLSAAEGADLIAQAQKTGQKVTVETCPHYLVLDNKSMDVYGPYAKCNPPLREKDNQEKLWRALRNGTISCLVSDHSPYTSEDKDSGLEDIRLAPPGINGLELGLPLMISEGVHAGKATLIDLALWMSTNPAKLMGIYPQKGHISIGADADFVLVDPKKKWEVVSEKLETKNKWSPYAGWQLQGKVMQTILRGKTVYQEGTFLKGAGYGKFVPCHLP